MQLGRIGNPISVSTGFIRSFTTMMRNPWKFSPMLPPPSRWELWSNHGPRVGANCCDSRVIVLKSPLIRCWEHPRRVFSSRLRRIVEVFAIDVHSKAARRLFPVQLFSFFPAQIFATALKEYQFTDATLAAPDRGASNRAAGWPDASISYFEKQRHDHRYEVQRTVWAITRRVVVVDDMLDTGRSLSFARRYAEQRRPPKPNPPTHG